MTDDAIAIPADEAASRIGVSKRTWLRMNRDGEIPAPRKIRSMIRWDVAELRAWSAAGMPSRSEWEARRQ